MLVGFGCAGVRTKVTAVEQAAVDVHQAVEAPVVIVTGASRGIGKAVALAMGKAGCKVRFLLHFLSFSYLSMYHLL